MTKVINIGGRIHSTEVGNVATGANEILDDTKGKKQDVINSETDAELLRLEQEKQDNLTFDNSPTENSNNPVKSGGVYAADAALQAAIEAILLLIPSAASSLNKLVDQNLMNSSIATNTATFRGTYNSVVDLHLAVDATHAQIAAALDGLIATADNNDYCYVQIPVSATSFDIEKTERYKFNGTNWAFEYQLNNSGFTAAQWAALNSGITAALVGDIGVIKSLIPAEATTLNQLADKAYVVTQIIANIPAFKGQFTTLTDLQAVQSKKAGDLGIVRTNDSDGYPVFTFYQYLNSQWNVFFTLEHHNQNKPASTGTTGDYPYNGMGRVVLDKNLVGGVPTLTQDMFKKGPVGSRVDNENTIFVILYDYILTADIYIPANCVLQFDGGSISGAYTITGQYTGIQAGLVKVFNTDTTLAGTWNLKEVYPEWFGAKGDDSTDDTTSIQAALDNTPINGTFVFQNKTYRVSSPLVVSKPMSILGQYFGFDSTNVSGSPYRRYVVRSTSNTHCFILKSIGVRMENLMIQALGTGNGTDSSIIRIDTEDSGESYIQSRNYIFRNLWLDGTGENMKSAISSAYGLIRAEFDHILSWAVETAFNIFAVENNISDNLFFHNCAAHGVKTGFKLTRAASINLTDCNVYYCTNAFYLEGCKSVSLLSCSSEEAYASGIYIKDSVDISIISHFSSVVNYGPSDVPASDEAIVKSVNSKINIVGGDINSTVRGTDRLVYADNSSKVNMIGVANCTRYNLGYGEITASGAYDIMSDCFELRGGGNTNNAYGVKEISNVTNEYVVLAVISENNDQILTPFSQGGNWYIRATDWNGDPIPSGSNITARIFVKRRSNFYKHWT